MWRPYPLGVHAEFVFDAAEGGPQGPVIVVVIAVEYRRIHGRSRTREQNLTDTHHSGIRSGDRPRPDLRRSCESAPESEQRREYAGLTGHVSSYGNLRRG